MSIEGDAYHLILVLHQELNALNGSSTGLSDGLERKQISKRYWKAKRKNAQRRHHPSRNRLESESNEQGNIEEASRIHTGELFGRLALLYFRHFGEEERSGVEVEGKVGESVGRKNFASKGLRETPDHFQLRPALVLNSATVAVADPS